MNNSFSEIFNASLDSLKKSLGIFSKQDLVATATGTQEAVSSGIENIKSAGKYFAVGGVCLVGLALYMKLK